MGRKNFLHKKGNAQAAKFVADLVFGSFLGSGPEGDDVL